MKIDINNGELFNVDENRSIMDAPAEYTINSNGYADTKEPFNKSRFIGESLNGEKDYQNVTSKLDHMESLIEGYVEDDSVYNGFQGRLEYLREKIEQVNPQDYVKNVFNEGEEKTYSVELSETALKYLRENCNAQEVLRTNISTGIHEGNLPDKEKYTEYNDTVMSILDEIITLQEDIMQEVGEEYYNPEYDEYDDDDYYDAYDDDSLEGYSDYSDEDNEEDDWEEDEEYDEKLSEDDNLSFDDEENDFIHRITVTEDMISGDTVTIPILVAFPDGEEYYLNVVSQEHDDTEEEKETPDNDTEKEDQDKDQSQYNQEFSPIEILGEVMDFAMKEIDTIRAIGKYLRG